MARLVSLILMATVIVLLGLTFYQVIAPFLMPLFLAGVLAVLCQPIHRRFLNWTTNRGALAAGLTTLVILTSILVPLTLGTVAAARQLYTFARSTLKGSDWTEVAGFVEKSAPAEYAIKWYEEMNEEPIDREELQADIEVRLRETARSLAVKTLGLAGSSLNFLGSAVAMLVSAMTFAIAFYYFLADGPALIAATEKLIPVHREYQRQLLAKFDQAVRAVVTATFAAALGQGLATGIGMELTGFHHFFIVTILATLTALVPVLGTWLIWGPYALWLAFHDGDWGRATFLALYGSIFVGLLDNVIRAYVLHTNVKLHPLLAFVSVLGGLEVMGLWGVFVGPIVASCLHALVKIFNTELDAFSEERRSQSPTNPVLAIVPVAACGERTEILPGENPFPGNDRTDILPPSQPAAHTAGRPAAGPPQPAPIVSPAPSAAKPKSPPPTTQTRKSS